MLYQNEVVEKKDLSSLAYCSKCAICNWHRKRSPVGFVQQIRNCHSIKKSYLCMLYGVCSVVGGKELKKCGKTFKECSSFVIASALFTPWGVHYVQVSYRFLMQREGVRRRKTTSSFCFMVSV